MPTAKLPNMPVLNPRSLPTRSGICVTDIGNLLPISNIRSFSIELGSGLASSSVAGVFCRIDTEGEYSESSGGIITFRLLEVECRSGDMGFCKSGDMGFASHTVLNLDLPPFNRDRMQWPRWVNEEAVRECSAETFPYRCPGILIRADRSACPWVLSQRLWARYP